MDTDSAPDFKLLFESAPGLYLVLRPDFTIVAASNSYLAATLTEREQIIGRNLFEVFPDNPADKNADGVSNLTLSLQYVIEHLQPHTMAVQHYDVRNKEGVFVEKYWLPLNSPVLNSEGELSYITHQVVDVTHSQQATEKLKKSERDYQLLVNSVKDYAIFMIDTNGCVASWNSGAETIKGYKATEIIGQPIDIFYTEEDIRNGLPKRNLESALKNGHLEQEGLRRRKDNSLFFANVVITVLRDDKGVFYGYSKITRDITERKKSQEQLELLTRQINQSNDAIFTTDAAGRIQSWNLGAKKLYGYSFKEVFNQYSQQILQTALNQHQIEVLQIEIDQTDYWSGQLKRKTKAGREIYVLTSVTTIRDSQRKITGYVTVSFDITEQRRLRVQVNHLAQVVEQSSDAIISRDMDQRLISWNRGAEVLFGYSSKEALGKTAVELGILRMSAEELAEISRRIIAAGSYMDEKVFFHRDGRSFTGAITANAVSNDQGEISSLGITIKDISIHKQLEDQLKKANELLEEKVKLRTLQIEKREWRFRALIENSNDIITLMDRNFKLLYRSPGATRITGWSNDDMLGMGATKNIHPDDQEYAAGVVAAVMAIPGESVYTRFRMLHKKGHILWVEGTLTNLLEDEFIKAVVFNFRDITERVQAEEKLKASESQFRHTLDNMMEGIQIHDFDWRYIYVNQALVGFSRAKKEELLGNAIMDVYPGIENTPLFAVLQRCMQERKTEHMEANFVFPDGTKSDFELSIQPVPEGLFILSIDITERKKMREQLQEREEQLELFIEHSPASLAMFDNEMKYLAVSQRWKNDYQLNGQPLVGKSHYEIFPEITADWKEIHQRCLKGTIEKREEDIFVRADGHEVWLRWEIRPWHRASGEIGGVISFSENITEKKMAEIQKEFDSNNLKALINNTGDLMWSIDKSYRLITYNDAFSRTFFSMTGKNAVKGTTILSADFSDDQLKRYKIYYDRALSGETFSITERFNLPGEVWVDISFYPIRHNNIVIGTACFSRDITAKVQAEQQLKNSFDEKQALAERLADILNTLPANITLLDNTGKLVAVNEAWRNFAEANNYRGDNYGIGSNYITIAAAARGRDKKDGECVAEGISAVIEGKREEFVYEYACHGPKEERWFRMIVAPLRRKEYRGAVVMHINISAVRRLEEERLMLKTEEQVKITQAMLQGQENERTSIGRELHDNVNQILVGTKLVLSIIAKDPVTHSSMIRSCMDNIQEAIDENRKIAHELVAPVLDNEHFCDQLTELCGEMLGISGIECTIDCKDFQEGMLGDQPLLSVYRIAQEQFTNIVKYAAASKVTITLCSVEGVFRMTIADNGVGMEPGKVTGGIGLRNIKGRLSIFNGTAKVYTAVGEGFRLEVLIPPVIKYQL